MKKALIAAPLSYCKVLPEFIFTAYPCLMPLFPPCHNTLWKAIAKARFNSKEGCSPKKNF